MTNVIHVTSNDEMKFIQDEKNEFMKDIAEGLSKSQKKISSKYFYDTVGSELFNKITRHPDYYLTQCEVDILNEHKHSLATVMGNQPFNLVELGPGEGIKTQLLINQFINEKLNFTYIPIDISVEYLRSLMTQLNQISPQLKLTPIHSDYFRGLEWLNKHSLRKNMILFLGSSIGNFDNAETNHFLRHLWEVLNHGDYVLLGFDMRKPIPILMRAYSDNKGITREFNLNLLRRINHELGGNFNIDKFDHYATYNVYTGAMESYLISLEKQTVYIEALNESYEFDTIEPIHVEYSYKYLPSQIQLLAMMNGFDKVKDFIDKKHYFVDTLWSVNKNKSRS